jgi:hypothetical protein
MLNLYNVPRGSRGSRKGKHREYIIKAAPDVGLLKNLGIDAGTQVVIRNRYAFGGPVVLRVEGAYTVAIGKDIAKQIRVATV